MATHDAAGSTCHETEYVTCNMDSAASAHIRAAELYLPLHIAPADKYVDAGAICSDESDGESGGAGTIRYHVTVSQAPQLTCVPCTTIAKIRTVSVPCNWCARCT